MGNIDNVDHFIVYLNTIFAAEKRGIGLTIHYNAIVGNDVVFAILYTVRKNCCKEDIYKYCGLVI